ncbi:MAG TPA: bacillithiol biosynthesis cysteine-adding enzyme BshC [Acidobacteriaceae bacterium]|nr:bacillithiol biosynthesis cysteine-adding enzyme BshC [Acidobacteriaceae bacterium]
MNADCYPVTALPHVSDLYRDYVSGNWEKLRAFYPETLVNDGQWMKNAPQMDPARRHAIVELLRQQNREFGAGTEAQSNLDRLAAGAGAVVTGQQVALFGGPLMTLMKVATAIHLAAEATRAGYPHVPIFWLATEDHDFDEVNQATVLCGNDITTLSLPHHPAPGAPVGNLPLGDAITPLVDELRRCLGETAVTEWIAALYTPTATFASAFAALLARIFSRHGLIVIDASSRRFHALAHSTLLAAIQNADDLHAALLERAHALEQAGYHAQVMVGEFSSPLFLTDATTGIRTALKKTAADQWSAGPAHYTTADLIRILDTAPERLSPNALLRPVVQDTLLPTSAYIGGPAEVAYFAQSEVLYQSILGRTTPILPRYSATLLDPTMAHLLHKHGLTLPDVFTTAETLAHRLGARAMPVEAKRKLAAAGNALHQELSSVTEFMRAQDQGLGHAADVAASKMLYQMNRLRRLSANFQLQRDQSLRRAADALCLNLFPNGNLQERVFAGVSFLARFEPPLVDTLVEQARTGHCGHHALFL